MLSACLRKGGGGWDWVYTTPHQKTWYYTIHVQRLPDKPAHYGMAKVNLRGSESMLEDLSG